MELLDHFLSKPTVAVLIGSLVTWVAAWWFYYRASMELRKEAQELRKATDLVLSCLTYRDPEVATQHDAKGNISGLTVNMSANLTGTSSLAANGNGAK